MRRAVLLDLDGTLVDSRADLALGVNLARAGLGLPELAPDRITAAVGDGVRSLLLRTLPECPERLEEALELNRAAYGAHLLDATRAYPGVEEALGRLEALGFRLGVVTNKPRAFTLAILEGLGLADRFITVVAGGDGPLKPDPAPLLRALAEAGCGAEGSWMAGDHATDLEAGRRAGLRRCLCRYGFGDPRGEAWDLAVDDLRDLARHLEAAGRA
jgi:phosphoglycolate phosphatase